MLISQTSFLTQSSVSNKEMNMDCATIVLIFNQLASTCSIAHHSCLVKNKSSQLTTKRKNIIIMTPRIFKTIKNCSRNSFTTMIISRNSMFKTNTTQIMSWKNSMLLVIRYAVIADGITALVNLVKLSLKSSVSKSLLVKSSPRKISTVNQIGKNLRKTESIT